MEVKRRGSLIMPKNPLNLTFKCKVHSPMYDHNGKKYIDIYMYEQTTSRVERIHMDMTGYVKQEKFMNPLQGNILKVKVPYRYNRVTCKISGKKVLQELEKNDIINVNIEFCGVWELNNYCGLSWKFNLVET